MNTKRLTQSMLAIIASATPVTACTTMRQGLEPQYVGGYPTEETAKAAKPRPSFTDGARVI